MAEPALPGAAIYAVGALVPRIAADAFVAPGVVVVGDVEIGAEAGIWFGCVLRGDVNFIRIGARTNIQDGSVVHVGSAHFPTVIGADVTIGHGTIIHGCMIGDKAFVGMGATVLNGAVIEPGGALAAGSLLAPGKRIHAGELWRGSPATLWRVMDEAERGRFARNAPHYVELARRFRGELRPVPR